VRLNWLPCERFKRQAMQKLWQMGLKIGMEYLSKLLC
jgi:hypothetical protein